MARKILISLPRTNGADFRTFTANAKSPYELVDVARTKSMTAAITDHHPHHHQTIGEIVPIHNVGGLRDTSQVSTMVDSINDDQHILEPDALPNIKLVVAPGGQLLLFDGHHSLLAYYQHGKRQLIEVPHLLISNINNGPITVNELAYFYPLPDRAQVLLNWHNYAVNWQVPEGQQLEPRQIFSITELAKAFTAQSPSLT